MIPVTSPGMILQVHGWLISMKDVRCIILIYIYIWVFPKVGGLSPKMDGCLNNGKPCEQMDDLGGKKNDVGFNTLMELGLKGV